MPGGATQKQINFALLLMSRAGFSTRFMNSEHKQLGATMRERSGSVEGWLRAMNVAEISSVIDQLKKLTEGK
jgi:hypothetical protein